MFILSSNMLECLYSCFYERNKYFVNPFKRFVLYIFVALACAGPIAAIFSSEIFAQSLDVKTYNIPAGTLADALEQFSKQSGVNFAIDPAKIQGIMTYGLQGNFDIETGLNQLLSESGLQAVPQTDGYAIKEIDASSSPDAVVTTLPSIQVTAASSKARYAAASSVTATKTNTLLRDTPQAISVITNELIKDQSIQSIGDAVRYVPGVGISQGEGNRDALVFRGNRSTGDFFTDGIRDDVQFFRDLYNIERIEILKGANGMIFGRGGSGGVVNRVTKQAGWEPIREFSFQGGSFNQKRMTADIGQGVNDFLAFRLNAMYEDRDSYRNGVDMRRRGISPTVTIKPTNRTTVVLNMERFHDNRTADRGIPSFLGRPVNVGRSQFFGDPDRSNAVADVLSFNAFFEHKFDIGITLNNRTNYAQYDKFYQNVFANTEVTPAGLVGLGAYNDTTDRENVFNQTNLLYSLDTGPIAHTLMAGIEIGRQITDNRRRTGFFDNNLSRPTPTFVTLSDSITNAPIAFVTRDQDANNRSVVNITSLYIQDQIEILPQLQAIAGVRYDLFEVDFVKRNGGGRNIKTDDGLLAPRFGLIYKPIEPVSFYASYSEAFVPRAGEQLTSVIVTRATLKPEKFTTLEAGFKWDIRPDLAFTGAVYQLDRSNVISAVTATESILVKGQRTKGIEVGLSGQILPNWSVMGGYAFQDGEFKNPLEDGARKGTTTAELPRHTFSIWNRYDFTPRFGAAFGVIHRSDMFASITNNVKIPGFTRVDAALYGQLNKYLRAQINIENLFNTKYIASVHNDNNLTPGSPIAVRASLIANF